MPKVAIFFVILLFLASLGRPMCTNVIEVQKLPEQSMNIVDDI